MSKASKPFDCLASQRRQLTDDPIGVQNFY
jgi:hypothetical protein